MSRAFTTREKVLVLILTLLLLAVGYVKLVYQPMQDALNTAENRRLAAEDAVFLEQGKLAQIRRMQAELDALKADGAQQTTEIPPYDNIENVMVELDTLLAGAQTYDLTFSPVEKEDTLVSRPIQMRFTAVDYAAAKQILTQLDQCRYRCVLSELSMAAQDSLAGSGVVTVTVTVTFYESN